MRKVLFLDRDGVINKDVSYLYKISDLEWVDGAKRGFQLMPIVKGMTSLW